MNFYNKKLNELIVFIIIVFITFGYIYKINLPGQIINLSQIRNFLIITLMILLIFAIYKEKFHKNLTYSTIFILTSIILNGLLGISKIEELFKPFIQTVFSFCLIQYSINNSKIIFEELGKYKNSLIIIGLIFYTANYFAITNNYILLNYLDGFGGNRVNFSISCVQIIGLSILISLGLIKNNQQEMLLFIIILGIISAQVISGGRAGLLISVLVYVSFILLISKRFKLIKLLMLVLTVYISRELTIHSGIPMNDEYGYTDIGRVHPIIVNEISNYSNTNNIKDFLYIILDQLSSYRLSILKYTIIELINNKHILIFGNGVNNFLVSVGDEIFEPHVVLLNQIGQYGTLYLIGVIYYLVSLLRNIRLKSFIDLYCIFFLILLFLQPALMHTQISTSILFFILSGSIIGRNKFSKQ